MNRDLARRTLQGILAFDHPIGQLMELVNKLNDSEEKAQMKGCCGTLLALQFDLVERIFDADPELRDEFSSERN